MGNHQLIMSFSSWRLFTNRIWRAIRLDSTVYERVEHDKSFDLQSISIIILSSVAAGIGSLNTVAFPDVLINISAALFGWFLWAYLTMFLGTRYMPELLTEATYGQMVRTAGFASSPGLFRIFGIVPYIGTAVFFIAQIWMLLAMVIAVKQALDYRSSFKPFFVSMIGWSIQIAIWFLIGNILNLKTLLGI